MLLRISVHYNHANTNTNWCAINLLEKLYVTYFWHLTWILQMILIVIGADSFHGETHFIEEGSISPDITKTI